MPPYSPDTFRDVQKRIYLNAPIREELPCRHSVTSNKFIAHSFFQYLKAFRQEMTKSLHPQSLELDFRVMQEKHIWLSFA